VVFKQLFKGLEMKHINLARQSKGFSLIELMVTIAVISLLMAIAIPNYISYRDKGYCSQAESEANQVSKAISDYFGIPTHNNLPTISDLSIVIDNPISITGDPNGIISIIVTDESGRCPDEYQRVTDNWDPDANTYVYEMKHP
jgi:type IV pilus assembly protein PilA